MHSQALVKAISLLSSLVENNLDCNVLAFTVLNACSAKVYPLEALMMDCQEYFKVTGRRVTFEYTVLAGVNDSPKLAEQLANLLKRFDLRSHVNLIPWNPVDESEFKRPDKAHVRAFAAVLDEHRVPVSIRVSRGMEAAAACGQLRNQHQKSPLQEFAALT